MREAPRTSVIPSVVGVEERALLTGELMCPTRQPPYVGFLQVAETQFYKEVRRRVRFDVITASVRLTARRTETVKNRVGLGGGTLPRFKFDLREFDDLISYLVISIIIGGRLGYVFFYNLEFYILNPLDIIKIWEGGNLY